MPVRCAVDIVQCAVGALRVLNVPDQPHLGPPPRPRVQGLRFISALLLPGPGSRWSGSWPLGWLPRLSSDLPRHYGLTWRYLGWPWLLPLDLILTSVPSLGLAFSPWTYTVTGTLGWPWLPFSGQPGFSRCGAEPHLSRSLPWYHIWFTTSWRAAGSFCSPTQQCDRLSHSCVLLCLITVRAIGYWALQRTKLKLRYWLCKPPGPGEKNTDVK